MRIHGIYISVEDYNTINFEDLESRGVTDIFCMMGAGRTPVTNYTVCVQYTNYVLNALKNTNLNLHVDISAFLTNSTTNEGWTTPEDGSHTALMCQNLSKLVTECNIQGVCFDDYYYHPLVYDPLNDTIESQALVNFALNTYNAIHDVDPSIKLTASTDNYNGTHLEMISPVFDIIMPQIYKYGKNDNNLWLRNTLDYEIKLASRNILPCFISYDELTNTTRTLDDITMQINFALSKNTLGYVLFNQKYLPYNLIFFDEPIKAPRIPNIPAKQQINSMFTSL